MEDFHRAKLNQHNQKARQLHEILQWRGRLSSLAIMHIKNDIPIDIDKVDNLFEGLNPRMMQLQSLLHENVFSYGLRLTHCSFHVGSLHVRMCFLFAFH